MSLCRVQNPLNGGIGSIFRAPLGAALFSAEVLYSRPDFEYEVLLPGLISAITGYSIYSSYAGWGLLFEPPPISFHQPVQLIVYALLGIFCALAGNLYPRIFYGFRDRIFSPLPIPRWTKPAVGALVLGLIAVKFPQALGMGYGYIQQALEGQHTIGFLLLFAVVKVVATSLTISSGGSGGVFGPSLVIVGSLGVVVGLLAQWVAPETFTQPGAFVVVGMAGFFAAAANTPISTLVMVSEMTGSYQLLLPSLWVCSISYMLGRRWSIYRSQVPSPFQSPAHRKEYYVDLLEDMRVKDVLRDTVLATIPQTASLDQVFQAFSTAQQEFLPVVDDEDRCLGMISLRTLRQLLDEHDIGQAVIARDIAVPPPVILSPDDPATQALQNLITLDLPELPVAAPHAPQRIIAMLARGDLVAAYNSRRLERLQERASTES